MRMALLLGLSLATFALAGCSGNKAPAPDASDAANSAAAVSGPDAKPGLAASGGRLVLPAVVGNPGAAYFTLTNSGNKDATVAAVSVAEAARSEIHETTGGSMAMLMSVPVPAGQSVAFKPGGKHVMVFDIPDTIRAGGSVELTVTFSDGDKLSTPLTVEAPGGMGEMADMPGMGHGNRD